MNEVTLSVILAACLVLPCPAADAGGVDSVVDRDSYSLGYQIGLDLKLKEKGLDPAAMRSGVQDGFSGAEPRLDSDEMQRLLMELKKQVVHARRREKQQAREGYSGEDREFLARNARAQGVSVLPSGLQYRVLDKGEGRQPGPRDLVSVHYRATTVGGREFYNSRSGDGGPDTVSVGGVVKGLSEALQLMREGDRWELFLPADLAYGERGPLADRAVIFDVELIAVEETP